MSILPIELVGYDRITAIIDWASKIDGTQTDIEDIRTGLERLLFGLANE